MAENDAGRAYLAGEITEEEFRQRIGSARKKQPGLLGAFNRGIDRFNSWLNDPLPPPGPRSQADELMAGLMMGGPSVPIEAGAEAGKRGAIKAAELYDTVQSAFLDKPIPGIELTPRGERVRQDMLPWLGMGEQKPGETVRRAMAEAPGRVAERGMEGIMETLPDTPPALAALATLPGAFLTEEAKDLPLMGLLKVAGKGAKAIKAVDALGNAAPDFMKFRGGVTDKGREIFEAADVDRAIARREVADLAGEMQALARTPEQEALLGMLTEQPEIRKALARLPNEPVDVNMLNKLAKHTRTVFGKTDIKKGVLPPEAKALLDVDDPKAFADMAERTAQEWGMLRSDMEALRIKDPEAFARFQEMNYNPIVYARETMQTSPSWNSSRYKENKDFLGMRTDMDKAARESMDQLGTVQATTIRMMQERNLINNRMVTEQVASDITLTPGPELTGTWKQNVEMIGSQRFVKMPDSKAYGNLAGRYVREAEAKEIQGMIQFNDPGNFMRWAKPMWSAWKFGKTILSPKTHIGNTVANTMMAHAAGLSPYRVDIYKEALDELTSKSGMYLDEAKQFGAPWTAKMGLGIEDIVDTGTISRSSREGGNMAAIWLESLGKKLTGQQEATSLIGKGYQSVANRAANLYQAEEQFFKHSLYVYYRKEGIPPTKAMKMADDAIINYDHAPQLVKQVRGIPGLMPFVSFSYGVTPIVTKTAIEKPTFFLHYANVAEAFNSLMLDQMGMKEEQWEKIKKLPMFQGTIPLIVGADPLGQPMVYDAARYTFFNDFIPDRPGSTFGAFFGDPMRAAMNIGAKSPLVVTLAALSSGVDPVTKAPVFTPVPSANTLGGAAGGLGARPRDITDLIGATGPGRDAMMEDLAGYGARQALPDLLGGGAMQNVWSAARGRLDFFGQPISPERAAFEAVAGKGRSATIAQLDAQRKIGEAKAGTIKALTNKEKRKEAQRAR